MLHDFFNRQADRVRRGDPRIVGGHHVCISADGHYRGSNGIEQHIVYVALTKDGHQQTDSPANFAAKFHWKNDPTKARLLQADK